jgi:hypothetical protein
MAESHVRVFYYLCSTIGTGEWGDPLRPSLGDTIWSYGCSWAKCFQDATQSVIAVSDIRGDGSIAGQLHSDLAAEGTLLGVSYDQALAAAPPEIAAQMFDGYPYIG